MKTCPRCGASGEKKFSKDKTKPSGLQVYCRACHRAYRAKNRKRGVKIAKEWRKKNPEKVRAACRKYHFKHRVQRLEAMKKWQAGGRMYAALKRWRRLNWDKVTTYSQNRRSRELNAEGSFTSAEWAKKKLEFRNRCAYCFKRVKLTLQHVVPLSKGGSNYISNIVPACGKCNSKIGAKVVLPGGALS